MTVIAYAILALFGLEVTVESSAALRCDYVAVRQGDSEYWYGVGVDHKWRLPFVIVAGKEYPELP